MRFFSLKLSAGILILGVAVLLTPRTAGFSKEEISRPQQRRAISKEFAKLVKDLRGHGASVRVSNQHVSQPFFSVRGRILYVNDESVWIYSYSTTKAAAADTGKVSLDGMTIGANKPSWLGTPHFFRRPQLIVVYLGDEQRVLDLLKKTLGEQFAGG